MDIKTKNKFTKYIAWCSIITLIGIGGLIPSIYFFAINYGDFFTTTNNSFWVGFGLVISMICCIAVILVSFSICWKLIHDYWWRIKQEKREFTHV